MSKSSKLLLEEEPLQVLPTLAVKIGLNRAMFLQQLHYWLKKSEHEHDGNKWIYNTFEEWHRQFPFWSSEAVRKIVSQLKSKGLIITTDRFNSRKGDRTFWYTIDYEKFNELLLDDQPDKSTEQPDKSTEPEPDKSTERYQRVPESSYRDSDLQSGEPQGNGSPQPEQQEEVKPEKPGAYFNRMTAELITEYKEKGHKFPAQTDEEKKKSGDQFKAEFKERNVATLDLAIVYRVQKAAGKLDGEFAGWSSFRYCLEQVDAGWKPGQPAEKAKTNHLPEHEQWKDGYYDHIQDFTYSAEPPPKKMTEEEKEAAIERLQRKLIRGA